MKIIILGAGLVGGPMAVDLAKDSRFEVHLADINSLSLSKVADRNSSIVMHEQDLSDPSTVRELVGSYDLVLSAVPGFMGFRTLQSVIEAGKNVVDIAFFPEDPFLLDELAREKAVVAIVDCGVAPGMSNVLIGHSYRQYDRTDSADIYVGGLPTRRQWPWDYKAPFSPIDVIEEYVRPARYVENGILVTRPALSDPEFLEFSETGTLEAFNSDGLRSLAKTLPIPNMKEKTLRYPGHIDKIRVLREMGLFGKEEIDIHGLKIRPLDVASVLLFPKWKLEDNEEDVTVMRIIVNGEKDGKNLSTIYELSDRFDTASRVHSMARTTGYTATMAVRMIAEGLYDRPGISPPEFIGEQGECVDFLLKGLAERGVIYRTHVIDVSDFSENHSSQEAIRVA